ncbi:MAG: exonuclease subunit SbcD [Cyclobacteriaceae bacterium]|nr:exonuclease subunit SbcD [Cyclobacteriaceae bacterium]MCH8517369.1 exonuclease subunit SbcD [Cyclobacteriaceae bacterium]
MKILHSADWHLGKKLKTYSRLNEQEAVLKELCDYCENENVDAILIAGDVFDTVNPSVKAIELYNESLRRLSNQGKRLVIVIAGNHDSAERLETYNPLTQNLSIISYGFHDKIIPSGPLSEHWEVIASDRGFVNLRQQNSKQELRVILCPYANELTLKQELSGDKEQSLREVLAEHWQQLADTYMDERGINIMIAHMFFTPESGETQAESEDEKPIRHVGGVQDLYCADIPPQVQYTALGHLHRYQNLRKNDKPPVVYSSSILAYSFAESNQQKYVVLLESDDDQDLNMQTVPIQSGRKLLKQVCNNPDEARSFLSSHPNALIELHIYTDSYLERSLIDELHDLHDGIIEILPSQKKAQSLENESEQVASPIEKSEMELFSDFFFINHQVNPSEELIDLFREIKSKKD